MGYSDTIDILINEINELTSIIKNFKKYDKIPRIEIDLVLSKMRDLYDLLLLLDPNNVETYKHEKGITTDANEKVAGEKKITDMAIPSEPGRSVRSDSFEKKTIADKFEGKQKSVNELAAKSSSKENLSAKIQSKGITDIPSAIGINDKFLFIKELFEGNKEKYDTTIDVLNKLNSFEDASFYLEKHFRMDKKNEVTKMFLELVKRRFTN